MKLIEILIAPIVYLVFVALAILSALFYVVGNLIDAFRAFIIGDISESKAYLNDACSNIAELKCFFVWDEDEENE